MIKKFCAAMTFMTVLPLPSPTLSDRDFGRLSWYFPLVGACLGVILGAAALGMSQIFPQLVTAAILTFLLPALSGALHLDGLADTADGFLSCRKRERTLEIMRDSHIGAMGVFAMICLMLIKFAVFASLPYWQLPFVAAAVPVAGRCALVFYLGISKYARKSGLAMMFYQYRTPGLALYGAVILFAASILLCGSIGIFASILVILFVIIWDIICNNKINGATGDTLGAACELAELVFLLAVICFFNLNQ
jgi:adenosylcobinamide-GDP ribazoletransferase